jgi:hypothetical protein
MELSKHCKLGFTPEPWLNCITANDYVIAYVWDTREVIACEKNPEAAKVIKSAPWNQCTYDVYNAFDGRPLLSNPRKIGNVDNFIQIAKQWVQPFIRVAHYQTRKIDKILRHEEYEIVTYVPGEGEVYIGEYVCEEYKPNKYRSMVYMDAALLKDVWPKVSKSAEKFTIVKADKILTFADIHIALLNGLTSL